MGKKKKPNVQTMFGEAVRKRRQELGISQEDLAHITGLHRTYMSDIERGVRNVSLRNIKKIADALGIQVYELFLNQVDPDDPQSPL